MGYKSDLRVITTKEGFKVLNDFVTKKNDKLGFNIIEKLNINKEFKNLVYIGWNRLNGTATDIIEESLYELEDNDISFRYCCIGENLDDIQEKQYTSEKDENLHIPSISYIRDFDEEYMEQQFKGYINNLNKIESKEMEPIEYE